MPAARKVTDIDALLTEDEAEVEVATIKVFDEEFRVYKDVNSFLMMQLLDEETSASAVSRLLVNLVHEEDRARFKGALGRQRTLTVDKLMKVFTSMLEVATDTPFSQHSASSPGRSTAKGPARSVAAAPKRASISKR